MRFHMLQLLKSLRSRTRGKEMTDADILSWANRKVRTMGRKSRIESFKVPFFTITSNTYHNTIYKICPPHLLVNQIKILQDKSLSSGVFFLDLLWAVEPRVVNWNLVTKGETGSVLSLLESSYFIRFTLIELIWFLWLLKHTDDERRLNATYIVSVARKLGCSVFLLPEDIVEVRTKIYNVFSCIYPKEQLLRWVCVWDVVTGESEDDPNLNGKYNVLESSETFIGEFRFVVNSEHHDDVHQHRRVPCSICDWRGGSIVIERRSLKLGRWWQRCRCSFRHHHCLRGDSHRIERAIYIWISC